MAQAITLDLVNINNRLLSGAIELSDGEEFTITGSGFGTKAGYFDFLDQSPIMTDSSTYPLGSNFGRVGRWSGLNFVGASNRPVITADGVAGKALYWDNRVGTQFNNFLGFYYDTPVPLGSVIYCSRWVKHRIRDLSSSSGGQWKSDRWQAATNSLSDKANETYKNIYIISATDNKIQMRDDTGVSGAGDKTLHSGSSIRTPILKNTHIRIDTKITLPSAYANKSEYKHEEWIWAQDSSVVPYYYNYTSNNAVDLASPYSSDASRWNMHLYQNYLGTGGGSGDFSSKDHEIWYSRVSEMVGDDARIEFGSTPNDANSPRSFMQSFASWSNTSIPMKFNSGDLNFGYLKVVRNNTVIKSVPVRVV